VVTVQDDLATAGDVEPSDFANAGTVSHCVLPVSALRQTRPQTLIPPCAAPIHTATRRQHLHGRRPIRWNCIADARR
jgi:hypothetical protein